MISTPGTPRVTLVAASRAFARHVHAGPPGTRDLHYLRDLRTLTDAAVRALDADGTHLELVAYQREAVLAVERARAAWRSDPGSAVAAVEQRVTRVLRFVLGPQTASTRRPRTVGNLERSIADAGDALVHGGVSESAVARRLRVASARCARVAEGIAEARARVSEEELVDHLLGELEAALDAHARLEPTWRLRLAMGADRVVDAWRQLVDLGVDPPLGARVVAASRAFYRAARQARTWDRLSADATAWVAPRDPDSRA